MRTTIRVAQQHLASQLSMVVKSHINGAIKSKSSKSADTHIKLERPTLPSSGLMVLQCALAMVVQF